MSSPLLINTSIYTIGRIIPQAAGFILLPLYTRYLTPADYGLVSAMQVLSSILIILFSLTLQGSIYRLYFDYKKENDRRDFLGTVSISLVIISVSVLILLFLFKGYVGKIYNEISFYPFYVYAIFTAFFSIYRMVPLIYFQINEKPKKFILTSILHFLLSSAFILWFIIEKEEGAIGMLKGQLFSGILVLPIFLYINYKIINFKFKVEILKDCLSYSLPTIPHVIAGWILDLSDRIFIERYYALADVGMYSIACKIGNLLLVISGAFRKAYMPYFYRLALDDNQSEVKKTLYFLNNNYLLFMMLGAFLLAFFSKEAILVLLDPQYHEAYKFVPIIVFSSFIVVSTGIINISITFQKKTLEIMYMALSCSLINLLINFLLIPTFGIIGAVYSTIISYLVYFILNYWYAKKCYFIPINWKLFIFYFFFFITLVIIFQFITLPFYHALFLKFLFTLLLLFIYFKKQLLPLQSVLKHF